MSAHLFCTCGWHTEVLVQDQVEIEVLAERHESQDYRRPYRHAVDFNIHEEVA